MSETQANYNVLILRRNQVLKPSAEKIRILFVVDGTCTAKAQDTMVELNKGDFLLINVLDEAILGLGSNSIVAVLEISYLDLCRGTGKMMTQFRMNSKEGTGQYYSEMHFMLQGLIMCYFGDREASQYQELGIYYLILQNLISHFVVEENEEQADRKEAKALEIIQYVRMNFRSNLSLTEIAEKMFLSRSAASRLFKQYTGELFPTYVKKLRLAAAQSELEQSNRSISEIAVNGGFSTPSAFNSAFKEQYGITPKEYREQHHVDEISVPVDEESRQLILHILEEDQKLGMPSTETLDVVTVDVNQSTPWNKWKNRLLNVGDVSALQSASMQKQVLFLQERLNIEYLRLWNPFSSHLMIFGKRQGEYNFSFLDEIFDFCVDHHLKVFLDMTPRRERAMASETREIYGSESKQEFQSAEEWLGTLEAFLIHLRRRYHDDVVGEWIFELTFSLNDRPYYRAERYDNLEVWKQSYRQIKSVFPSARVAGPGLVLGDDPKGEERINREIIESDYAPDIFTSIHFPYRKRKNIYQGSFEKDPSRYFLKEQIALIREILDRYGFRGEYWITEYGISIANRNYMQDSCYRGAAIVDSLLQNLSSADAMGAFYSSDLLNAFSDTSTVLSGSAGLLSRSGIRKPAYYGYRFFRQLGSRIIKQTSHCVITAENTGDIRALCWNQKNLGPLYYVSEENSFHPDDLGRLFENLDPWWMELVLTGFEPDQPYRVRQRILNDRKGSVLHKWIDLGCSDNLNRDDLEYLEQASIPEVVSETLPATGGEIRVSFCLEANEMRLITITKE